MFSIPPLRVSQSASWMTGLIPLPVQCGVKGDPLRLMFERARPIAVFAEESAHLPSLQSFGGIVVRWRHCLDAQTFPIADCSVKVHAFGDICFGDNESLSDVIDDLDLEQRWTEQAKDEECVVQLLPSSGSSGVPKLSMVPQRSLLASSKPPKKAVEMILVS